MNARLAEQGIRFREFRLDDIPAMVDVLNRTYPDQPTTVERETHFEKAYPPDKPRLRFVVEAPDGRFIGMGLCAYPFWLEPAGVYWLAGVIDPAWRGRDIARAMLAEFESFAHERGAACLWSDCREDFDFSIRFFERAGFKKYGLRFESELDLIAFDESRFPGAVDRVLDAGFHLSTLAAERSMNPQADEQLYELDSATARDVPLPGGARLNLTYADFRARTLDNPESDPTAVFIAKRGKRYVGHTALWLPPEGPALTSSTGVLREYRGRGIALALKLLSIRVMKARGYAEARTNNDTGNPAILKLNEKLGYRKRPGWLQWEKHYERS